jgi:phosphonate transport system permease protein
VLVAAVETIQIAILGTVFGIMLSVPLAFLGARNVTPIGWASWLIKGIGALERAVPSLIWAILFIVAVGFGPTAGIMALAVGSVGMLLKAYAESIEEVPEGPIEALRAMGATKFQIAFQGVLPAVLPVFVAWSVFRWDINVRYSTLLGIVGAGGLGFDLIRAARTASYDRALGISLVILVIIMGSELLSNWLQQRIEGPRTEELITIP